MIHDSSITSNLILISPFSYQLFDYIVNYHHNQLRVNGYHDFHNATKAHKSIPLAIVSLWNSTILAVAAGLQHYYGEGFFESCFESYFSPVVYVTAFTVAETLIFFVIHGSYIKRVCDFNNAKLPPDALQGINTASGSVGLMQRGADVQELLEKQGKLYLIFISCFLQQTFPQFQRILSNTYVITMPT